MAQIIRDMREIYRIRHHDFMGYTFDNIKQLSFHHIKKACNGGLKVIENGALLNSTTSHPYLHLIEDREIETYDYINSILQEITDTRAKPTIEQLKAIREALLGFEKRHEFDTNRKGKLLIKKQYIDRRIKL